MDSDEDTVGEGPWTSAERGTSRSLDLRRKRSQRYREAHREEIRERDRSKKRVAVWEDTFLRLQELQAKFGVKGNGEVIDRLLERERNHEEHSAKNQDQGWRSPSSSSDGSNDRDFQEDGREISGGKASLPASIPSPSAGSEHPAEPDSGVEIDISVSYIERKNFVYPNENPDDDSEDNDGEDNDSDFAFGGPVIGRIQDGVKCENLEQKGQEEGVLRIKQEPEEEEGTEKEESREMPTISKSGLDVEAQQAVDSELFLISSSRLADLARMVASQCSTCGAPLTTSVTPENIAWKCPSGHTKVWSTQETLKGPNIGNIKRASSSWKRHEPKYHHNVIIKLRPELEVIHKSTDSGLGVG